MNSLDSRALKIGDCFGLSFPTAGRLRYALSSGAHAHGRVGPDEGFSIEVKPKSDGAAQAAQHNVLVKRDGNEFSTDTTALSINVGDNVLWYTTDPRVFGFAVAGSAKEFAFSSHALKAEAVYSHAFGLQGTYEWVDPLNPEVSGVVVVQAVASKTEAERQAWFDSLSKATAFEIRAGKVTPHTVRIVVGQTVFWKVWDGDGIAVVDKRLIVEKGPEHGDSPARGRKKT